MSEEGDPKMRQRKTTLCCLEEDAVKCQSKRWHIIRFAGLIFIAFLILCCVYGLRSPGGHKKKR